MSEGQVNLVVYLPAWQVVEVCECRTLRPPRPLPLVDDPLVEPLSAGVSLSLPPDKTDD